MENNNLDAAKDSLNPEKKNKKKLPSFVKIIALIVVILVVGFYAFNIYTKNRLSRFMDSYAEEYTSSHMQQEKSLVGEAGIYEFQHSGFGFYVNIPETTAFPVIDQPENLMLLFSEPTSGEYLFMVTVTKNMEEIKNARIALEQAGANPLTKNLNGIEYDYYLNNAVPPGTNTYITSKGDMYYVLQSRGEVDYAEYFGFLN